MPSVFGFREKTAQRLLEIAGQPRDTGGAYTEPVRKSHVLAIATHYKTPVGGIPAKVGLQMGSASCEKYNCSSTGLLSLSGISDPVYNPVGIVIGGGKDIVAQRNTAGLMVAIVEPCD